MQKYTYICWIHTDAKIIRTPDDKVAGINNARKEDAGRLLYKKFLPHIFICKFRKGCSKFACERELETEHYWNILTSKLWPSALCLSRSSWLLNRTPRVHSPVCWLSLLHRVFHCTACPPSHLSSTVLNSSPLYYLQTPTQ